MILENPASADGGSHEFICVESDISGLQEFSSSPVAVFKAFINPERFLPCFCPSLTLFQRPAEAVFLCLEEPPIISSSNPHHMLSFPVSPSYLRRTPPSREALRHSGGERRRCTSPTVTLYLEVELSSERRPGTEQKTSAGLDTAPTPRPSLPMVKAERDDPFSLDGMGTGRGERKVWTRLVRSHHHGVNETKQEDKQDAKAEPSQDKKKCLSAF